MRDLRVTLPAPCDESWEVMAPRGCNRLCAACDTVVHELSALTVDQADALLDSGEPVCVRAHILQDGTIRTASRASRSSRRIVASVGAGVLLATAACQTATLQPETPRYRIEVQLQSGYFTRSAHLVADDGQTRTIRLRGNREFGFNNLSPGRYTLSFVDNCGRSFGRRDIVLTGDLSLADVDLSQEDFCIIVGMMQRADETTIG